MPTTKTEKPIPKLQPNPFIHEILELACKQRTRAKKIEVLREYRHDSLIVVFLWNYVKAFQSDLPEGEVPYAALQELRIGNDSLSESVNKRINTEHFIDNLETTNRTSIRREYERFHNFIKGRNHGLTSIRRETMFIEILEGLHPKESEILILIKDKNLTSKYNLSFDIIREAFPDVPLWDLE
jgi:hypothetical protein